MSSSAGMSVASLAARKPRIPSGIDRTRAEWREFVAGYQAPSPPASIANLSPPAARSRAEEVWNAACTLKVSLEIASDWFTTLWLTLDEDSLFVNTCLDRAACAIRCLVAARAGIFQNENVDSLLEMLPPRPSGQKEFAGVDWCEVTGTFRPDFVPSWQNEPRLWNRWFGTGREGGAKHSTDRLIAQAWTLLCDLRKYPLAALGLDAFVSDGPPAAASRTFRGGRPRSAPTGGVESQIEKCLSEGMDTAKIKMVCKEGIDERLKAIPKTKTGKRNTAGKLIEKVRERIRRSNATK